MADRTARTMPSQPYPAARDGASFTELPFGFGTITANTLERLGDDHLPATMLVMGGANDVLVGVAPDRVIAEMQSFEEQVGALGVTVRWVLEPELAATGGLAALNRWLLDNRPDAIDCRSAAGPSLDGIHPVDYSAFALCVDDALTAT
jgi:hypothetical protein